MDRRSILRGMAVAAAGLTLGCRETLEEVNRGQIGSRQKVGLDQQKISLPGWYNGYSTVVADGYTKHAQYVPVRDGCKLALDIYRPTVQGEYFDKPLPTIFISTGYRRSFVLKEDEDLRENYFPQFEYGDTVSFITRGARLVNRHIAQWFEPIADNNPQKFRNWLIENASVFEFMLMHGYNFVYVDNRATGASFGKSDGLDHQTQGMDLADLFEWAVAQEWSNESIGMMGSSWLGLAQNAAISCQPKYLKAVMPCVAGEDTFTPMYPGGLYNVGLMRGWYKLRDKQERGYEADVVDEDVDGSMLKAAIAERRELTDDPHWVLTIPTEDELEPLLAKYGAWSRDRYQQNSRYYDRDLPDGTRGDWKMGHLDPRLANQTDIAYYGVGGYWDLCGYTMAMAYADLTVPKKMVMGPWNHANYLGTLKDESLRWFDYHLKGIDNGIMDQPSFTYSTSHPTKPLKWYGADQFPPSGMTWQTLYAAPENKDDPLRGVLAEALPDNDKGSLSFKVDYNTTTGLGNRQWGYFLAPHLNIGELERYRDRVLTLLSEPLSEDMEITGYPVLKFQLAISSDRGGVIVQLQDIAPDGSAYPVSEGQLNLRDRRVSEPPYNYLGLPYHSVLEKDQLPVTPNIPMDIEIALCPTSWVVPKGHRLCLTVMGADKDNSYVPVQIPAPQMTVFCNSVQQMSLNLPVMPKNKERGAVLIRGAYANITEMESKAISPSKIEIL